MFSIELSESSNQSRIEMQLWLIQEKDAALGCRIPQTEIAIKNLLLPGAEVIDIVDVPSLGHDRE
jgi:hypothetical protein